MTGPRDIPPRDIPPREISRGRASPGDTSLSDEAIAWVATLQSGAADPEDRAAFARWRAESPAHEAAARAVEALWQDLGETATARVHRPASIAAPIEPPSAAHPRVAHPRITRPVASRRLFLGGALAASVTAVIGAVAVNRPLSALFADFATRTGERRLEHLPDGSTVLLNTATSLSIDFAGALRRLVLHEGEALLTIVADGDRPFVVTAAEGETRSMPDGDEAASLNIRRDGMRVEVASLAGTAEVAAGDAALRLAAGESIDYDAGGFVTPVAVADLSTLTAWRRGKLIFNRRPLAEVCGELHRYGLPPVYFATDGLKRLPVTGVFDLADLDGALATIQQTFGVEVLRLPFLTVLRQHDRA